MFGITGQHHAGRSKNPFSKAAASNEARRTLRHVEPLSDARTPLADFFSILLDRADTTRRYYKEQAVGLSIWPIACIIHERFSCKSGFAARTREASFVKREAQEQRISWSDDVMIC